MIVSFRLQVLQRYSMEVIDAYLWQHEENEPKRSGRKFYIQVLQILWLQWVVSG